MKRNGMKTPSYWGDHGRGVNAPNPYSQGYDPSRMVSASERVYDTTPGECRSLSRAEIKAWEAEHPAYRSEKRDRTEAGLYLASSRGRGGKFSRALADPRKSKTETTGFKFSSRATSCL